MNGIKPPYKVPSMAEIEAIPWNGYNVVSTFSGGGGSCLGYRMAGFRVLWANEFVEEAQNTYRANHKGVILDTRDIREVQPEDILNAIGMKAGEIDLFDGSPPCCAFSTAGKREKSWNQERDYSDGKTQRIENLFFEYTRLLKGLQPKTFVAENVSGLVKGTAIGYFKEFIREMRNCGYNVKANLLNSAWLGVPQTRQRLIFMGVRKDLGLEPVYPKPYDYFYTVGDALEGVINDPEEVKARLEWPVGTKYGELLRKMPKNPKKRIRGSDITGSSFFSLCRESMYQPASTIMAAGTGCKLSGQCHPLYDRKFTIAELKRIASLPDDFILTGDLNQQGERIGRMVPPVMMMNIAKSVKENILDKLEGK